jgi:hypothetical protein
MNPPSVYELTIPNSQRIKSNTAIVQSIVIPFQKAVSVQSTALELTYRAALPLSSKAPREGSISLYLWRIIKMTTPEPWSYSVDVNDPIPYRIEGKGRYRM